MMGLDSVAYHEHTVAGRGDDPVAGALEYYASRGETPMVWGGQGRLELGLDGEVDLGDWRAVFAPGGTRDPLTGQRLTGCRRPGMELVISPHKSVAELGVIGRAEDMHQIVDAERDATLAYLDRAVQESGGRRGRAGARVPTGGLVWAVSRHATTRAGDPQVHDHVLVANVVSMRDTRGGWKGLDTAFLRDHLHAATAVGRLASAAKAVELGYGIEADPGRSGRVGGWAITGIPRQAWEIHSTRTAQIDAAVGRDASYRSRSVAARATRDRKTVERVEDLVGRWWGELAAAGYPPLEIEASVEHAGLVYRPPDVSILDKLPEALLGPGGRLAEVKTFTRDDVIVAAAPMLHGLPVEHLQQAVDAVLGHDLSLCLPAVAGCREAVYAARCVVEDENRVAELAGRLATSDGPRVDPVTAAGALGRLEAERGLRLTATQRGVAEDILTSRGRLSVVIGVAGSGKTTTLAAVRAGYEAAGYTVIGSATSGQAAKTLGAGAGIDSRTVASLSWRLDNDRLRLTARHVVILDEAGMTTDADVAKLAGAVEAAGAKLIVVGDYHQLDAVGPGGALEALTRRHPETVWTLGQNLRQADPTERQTLDQLRAGSVQRAVEWYADNGRIHAQLPRDRAIAEMTAAWAADAHAGKESLLLAYRKDNVDALNRSARAEWESCGHLSGPELHASEGRVFRAGDRIITLTPGPRGAWTTSQQATVTAVDLEQSSISAVTPDGNRLHITGDYLGADRLAYGYAITAHRSQGATVATAHFLADGGGRELAYVAMSRARGESHVYLAGVAPAQAAERLAWEWSPARRQVWTLQPQDVSLADLHLDRQDLLRQIPSVPAGHLEQLEREHRHLARDLELLRNGQGNWAYHPAGRSAQQLRLASQEHEQALHRRSDPKLGWLDRRRAERDLQVAAERLELAQRQWQRDGAGIEANLETRIQHNIEQIQDLDAARQARDTFLAEHPDLVERLHELDRAIEERRDFERQQQLELRRQQTLDHGRGIHHDEPDLGIGL